MVRALRRTLIRHRITLVIGVARARSQLKQRVRHERENGDHEAQHDPDPDRTAQHPPMVLRRLALAAAVLVEEKPSNASFVLAARQT